MDEEVGVAKVSLEWEWGAGVGVREAKESKGTGQVHWEGKKVNEGSNF